MLRKIDFEFRWSPFGLIRTFWPRWKSFPSGVQTDLCCPQFGTESWKQKLLFLTLRSIAKTSIYSFSVCLTEYINLYMNTDAHNHLLTCPCPHTYAHICTCPQKCTTPPIHAFIPHTYSYMHKSLHAWDMHKFSHTWPHTSTLTHI